MTTLAVTGHRPDRLGGYGEAAEARLARFAVASIERMTPTLVISGMALGWDQAIADACVTLDIPFIAALPFEGQASRWPTRSVERHSKLCASATEVVVVSKFPGAHAMQLRNQWMVDRADKVAALWDGGLGGTRNCFLYALKKKVPMTNLWSRWEQFS